MSRGRKLLWVTEPGAPEDIQFSENPKSSGLQTQHGHHCSYELQSPQPAMSMPLLQQLAILPSSSVHKATTDAFPEPQSQSVQDRSSSLASVTSRVATAPGTSQDPPLVHGPCAVPAVVADLKLGSVTPHIIQLGPIFQPMLNSLQANPFYIARPLAQQAPLALMPRNQDTSPSSQIAVQLQKMLKAAQAVGYSQALRQQAMQPGNLSRLSFSKHRIQAQAGEAAEIPHSAESQHGQHDSHRPQPESRQGHQSSDTHTGSTHQGRLVSMTGPRSSAAVQSTARHMVAFRCNLADIVDAHWGQSSQAASAATTEPQASFEAAGITHGTDSNVATMAEPNRALPQVPLASSGDMVGTVQPSHMLAASRLHDTGGTSALPSLTPAPQVMARRALPPPQRATAQSVAVAVAAAQGTDWALAAHAAAARSSMGGSFPNLALQNQQGAPAQTSTSLGAQHGAPFHSSYMLSSFPQVMQQLMLEPSMEFMHSWVASHQPPVPASGQLVTSAAHLGHGQEDARSAKRLCHGVESQQPAALSSAAAAAASALHPVSSKQLPQLTSIQLLKHRARQHVANAGAHSFTASIPNLHSFPQNPHATDQAGTPAMTSTAQIDLTQTSGAAEQSSSAVASGPAQIDLTQEPPDVNQSGLPSTAGTAQLGLPPGGVLRSTQPGKGLAQVQ